MYLFKMDHTTLISQPLTFTTPHAIQKNTHNSPLYAAYALCGHRSQSIFNVFVINFLIRLLNPVTFQSPLLSVYFCSHEQNITVSVIDLISSHFSLRRQQ